MAQSAAWLPKRRSVVEASALARPEAFADNLRQPLRDRLRPRFDQCIALEMGGLQGRVAGQRKLVELLQIVGGRGLAPPRANISNNANEPRSMP